MFCMVLVFEILESDTWGDPPLFGLTSIDFDSSLMFPRNLLLINKSFSVFFDFGGKLTLVVSRVGSRVVATVEMIVVDVIPPFLAESVVLSLEFESTGRVFSVLVSLTLVVARLIAEVASVLQDKSFHSKYFTSFRPLAVEDKIIEQIDKC